MFENDDVASALRLFLAEYSQETATWQQLDNTCPKRVAYLALDETSSISCLDLNDINQMNQTNFKPSISSLPLRKMMSSVALGLSWLEPLTAEMWGKFRLLNHHHLAYQHYHKLDSFLEKLVYYGSSYIDINQQNPAL
ncbi:MAG: hypothetical protein R2865_14105 [Deinococcales bacterium]